MYNCPLNLQQISNNFSATLDNEIFSDALHYHQIYNRDWIKYHGEFSGVEAASGHVRHFAEFYVFFIVGVQEKS